jgi:hypothetical protein
MSIAIEGWSVHGSMLLALNTGFVGVKSKLILLIFPISCLGKNFDEFRFLFRKVVTTFKNCLFNHLVSLGPTDKLNRFLKCSSQVGKSKKVGRENHAVLILVYRAYFNVSLKGHSTYKLCLRLP